MRYIDNNDRLPNGYMSGVKRPFHVLLGGDNFTDLEKSTRHQRYFEDEQQLYIGRVEKSLGFSVRR